MNPIKQSVLRKRLNHVIKMVPPDMWDVSDSKAFGDPLQIALNTDKCTIEQLSLLVEANPVEKVRAIVHSIDRCHDLTRNNPYASYENTKEAAQQESMRRLKEAVAAL